MRIDHAIGGLLLVAAVAGAGLPAGADMLAKEQCDQIKAEQTALGPKKLREAMEKGPGWAKANLTSGEFDLMRKYIELEEQWLFRCPQPKPPKSLAKAAPADDRDDEEKPAAKAPAKKAPVEKADGTAKKPADTATKKASPDAKPAPKPAASPKPPVQQTPAPPPKPKSADAYVPPKTKANDAYVPPPKAQTTP